LTERLARRLNGCLPDLHGNGCGFHNFVMANAMNMLQSRIINPERGFDRPAIKKMTTVHGHPQITGEDGRKKSRLSMYIV